MTVNSNINEFNITGDINNNNSTIANLKKINLTIISLENSYTKTKNITCENIKIKNVNINLQCSSEEKLLGKIDSSYSSLENEILIIILKKGQNDSVYFPDEKFETNEKNETIPQEFEKPKYYYKKK